ncbi:MAG: amidohydrolase family protein [Desulfurococcales archaeon]|jgi:predicted TIM-barrel fold metal-dependent hydrolase|nr:amidohydrolase family protein [Desulfurococcales archaeon]
MIFEHLRGKGVGIVDVHVHTFYNDDLNKALLKAIDKFNVERAFISVYPFDLGSMNPDHESVARGNRKILELARRYSVFRGVVFVNLLNSMDLYMAEKFLKEGFRGIGEIYRSVKPRIKLIEPYIELAKQYDVPLLIHIAHRIYPRSRPREADIGDLCRITRRWPRIRVIAAHIGGGGDWENTVEMLRLCDARNLYIDTGGSVGDSYMIEDLVKHYYKENILFGSDNIYTTSIARIEGADIDPNTKIMIYRDNPCKVFSCD